MRFKTRYDRWLVAMLAAVGLFLFLLPIAFYSTLAERNVPVWPFLTGPTAFILAISTILPQYYELREQGLFIRQGWKKILLSYSPISELRIWNSIRSAPVLSTHRLLVTAGAGRRFVIAVDEQERFLAEVASRAPQLEPCSFGLRVRDRAGRSRLTD